MLSSPPTESTMHGMSSSRRSRNHHPHPSPHSTLSILSCGSRSSSSSSSPWIRKPLSVVHQQQEEQQQQQQENHHSSNSNPPSATHPQTPPQILHRHLSVWDLIGIGVGGTVGSGIFVLTGQIASQYAGRATCLSFLISGAAACTSGICYAELSGRIPAPGSTYVYAYICWGEWAAVIAAACLTLEYGVAGAAVARTWGDKVLLLFWNQLQQQQQNQSTSDDNNNNGWFQPNGIVNIPALMVSAVSTGLLLMGIKESKRVMNAVTLLKMCIVLFMIVGGFMLYDPVNVSHQSFAPFGTSGVLRGATTSFFGYLGYDEICCVAGEAKHPARDLPRAVLGTLVTVTSCYVLAAIALTGMLPYSDISATAGFPDAFHQRDWEWAAQLTAAGEVATLPVVVLISLMAQPRLTFSMSMDGLLPSIFGRVDTHGNMVGGTFVAGTAMTIISAFVPFTYLDDLISAGILLAFSMTNSCLVLLRCESPIDHPYLLEHLLICYNALCFVSSMLWSHNWSYLPLQFFFATMSTLATAYCLIHLTRSCHRSNHFGGSILSQGEYTQDRHVASHNDGTAHVVNGHDTNGAIATTQPQYFTTPMVPYLPCLGMAVNWYLIAQLDITGIFLLLLYLGIISTMYLLQCAPNSIGHVRNWNRGTYETVQTTMTAAVPRRVESNEGYRYDEGENELGPIPPHLDGVVRSLSMT